LKELFWGKAEWGWIYHSNDNSFFIAFACVEIINQRKEKGRRKEAREGRKGTRRIEKIYL
jgi:hypothetical protein